ncbi:hypothetical protein KW805_00270 [Candidatus Pacearchaeota archaeon]|nr:hypothetical protein [Candidatus Pacearchaeota archaeon]
MENQHASRKGVAIFMFGTMRVPKPGMLFFKQPTEHVLATHHKDLDMMTPLLEHSDITEPYIATVARGLEEEVKGDSTYYLLNTGRMTERGSGRKIYKPYSDRSFPGVGGAEGVHSFLVEATHPENVIVDEEEASAYIWIPVPHLQGGHPIHFKGRVYECYDHAFQSFKRASDIYHNWKQRSSQPNLHPDLIKLPIERTQELNHKGEFLDKIRAQRSARYSA